MAKLPTFSGDLFNWKKGEGRSTTSKLNLNRFPSSGFYIRSPRTGELKLFLCDAEVMENNEFFDGEAMAFMSPGGGVRVQIWVGE